MFFIQWVMILLVYQQNNMLLKQESIQKLLQKKIQIDTENSWINSAFLSTGVENLKHLIQITINGHNGFLNNYSIHTTAT